MTQISRRAWLKTFAGLSAASVAQFDGLLRSAWAQTAPPLRLVCLTQPHGITSYWRRFVGDSGLCLGLDRYGESAPAPALAAHFGFTGDAVAQRTREWLKA